LAKEASCIEQIAALPIDENRIELKEGSILPPEKPEEKPTLGIIPRYT
jgi:hypothetical protein